MSRPRGFADWRPTRKTAALLEQVQAVLDEYETYLPLTLRQVFYRLVGAYGHEKTEKGYARLGETLNRARRAGLVPFEAIRDDGVMAIEPTGFAGKTDFWRAVETAAAGYRRDRLDGQPAAVELWVEASGMAPQLANALEEYGVPVFSSGGFDSTTAKHEAATRIARRDRPTAVLHVGDFDPSGLALFTAAAEDVGAFAEDLSKNFARDGWTMPTFERVAVTPEQIERFDLPSAPAKRTDRRSVWRDGDLTVQAEALPPDTLASQVRAAVRRFIDGERLAATVEDEHRERAELVAAVDEWKAS